MRRSALLSALGALGQGTERRMLSPPIMQVSRACGSVYRPAKALPGQLGNRFVQRRGLKRQVARLRSVGLVDSQGLAWFHSEAILARINPDREVGHPRRLIEPDVGQVPESRSGGIEQRAEDSRSYLLEFAPELTLVAAPPGLHVEELGVRERVLTIALD